MPYRTLRPCAYPGCDVLVRFGRCDDHRQALVFERDPERQRLYNLAAWEQRRLLQLAREPWCAECLRNGIYTPASDVDHVVPHRGDQLSFMTGELQSLCHSCHSKKTIAEQQGRGH